MSSRTISTQRLDAWFWRRIAVSLAAVALLVATGAFAIAGGPLFAGRAGASPESLPPGPGRAFGLEGPVMRQLLQGFGADALADAVGDLRLDCTARVLEERTAATRSVLNVRIECDCIDPDGGEAEPAGISGDWMLVLDR